MHSMRASWGRDLELTVKRERISMQDWNRTRERAREEENRSVVRGS